MKTLHLNEIAECLGLKLDTRNLEITSIATDSRKVDYGSLFAALPGTQVDGHDFAESAKSLGAVAMLVERELELDVPQLLVEDVLAALGKIALMLREKLDPTVVGITGSNGKTTVKEMVASILAQQHQVLATSGNFNNELGLPLTLFQLEDFHQYAVLELGASKRGDIDYLASIAQPDVALITNIGPAHLEGFGSVEGVAKTKGEIFNHLPSNGWAVFNGDEPWCDLWREHIPTEGTLSFGEGPENDVRLESESGLPRIHSREGSFDLLLNLPGKHNQINATAATAVALALDVPLSIISSGLASVEPVPGRLNLLQSESGWTVIDDTYNANPASLYSALQVLAGMQGTAWLVLGDMKELGDNSRKLHAEVGDAARVLGVSRIFALGDLSSQTVDAFGEGAQHFETQSELTEALMSELRPGINCLVKGSRSMGMEHVVNVIAARKAMQEAC